ncbi:MAG: hypothetical protein U1F51_18190 [Burkholderiales bacterium]
MRRPALRATPLAIALVLGACAQAPSAPDEPGTEMPPPRVLRPGDGPREDAARRHREHARTARAAGDLATARDHLHVVAMLHPEDEPVRRELEALRVEIQKSVREHQENARAAFRSGDTARASAEYLRVLALDPRNAEAARTLRDIDRQNMARAQAGRAARVRVEDLFADARAARVAPAATAAGAAGAAGAAAAPAPDARDIYDIDQRLEMLRAGDTAGALRELKAWVDTHPRDRTARQRIGAAVADKAKETEGKGQRDAAIGLYEQALALRGEPQVDWSNRIAALKKAVGEDAYNEGVKLMRTDLPGAIRSFEAALRADPQNTRAATRLREAKAAQEKLSRMPAK